MGVTEASGRHVTSRPAGGAAHLQRVLRGLSPVVELVGHRLELSSGGTGFSLFLEQYLRLGLVHLRLGGRRLGLPLRRLLLLLGAVHIVPQVSRTLRQVIGLVVRSIEGRVGLGELLLGGGDGLGHSVETAEAGMGEAGCGGKEGPGEVGRQEGR